MNHEKIKQTLINLELKIHNAPRRPMFKENWVSDVPKTGGVYVIWEKSTDNPVYVGETVHLQHRLSDLSQFNKHTFRRKVAKTLGLFDVDANTLSKAISERYELSFLSVPFGRKEVEEYLILKWEKTLINKPPVRLKLNENYSGNS